MQRIIVDLPEPDGPMTTTTSWRATLRSMSRSAWNVPKNFCTPINSSIASPVPAICVASAKMAGVFVVPFTHRVPTPSRRSSRWLSRLIVMHPTQNRNITNEIVSGARPWPRKSGCAVATSATLSTSSRPIAAPASVVSLNRLMNCPTIDGITLRKRLRQNDQGGDLHRLQPERLGCLGLPPRKRLQSAANDLGDVGGGEQGEHDDRPHDQPRRLEPAGQEEAEGDAAEEQEHVERHAAEELDVGDRHDPHERKRRRPADAIPAEAEEDGEADEKPRHHVADIDAAADEQDEHRQRQEDSDDDAADEAVGLSPGAASEGEQHSERKGQPDAGRGEEQVEHHPFPFLPRRRDAEEPDEQHRPDDSDRNHWQQPASGRQATNKASDDRRDNNEGGEHGRAWRRGQREEDDDPDDQWPDPHDQLDEPLAQRQHHGLAAGDRAHLLDISGENPAVGGNCAQSDADPPELVAGIAADHEQREVALNDLPATGHEHEAGEAKRDIADDHRGDHRDDAVNPRAEQVASSPVAGTCRRFRWGLRWRQGH